MVVSSNKTRFPSAILGVLRRALFSALARRLWFAFACSAALHAVLFAPLRAHPARFKPAGAAALTVSLDLAATQRLPQAHPGLTRTAAADARGIGPDPFGPAGTSPPDMAPTAIAPAAMSSAAMSPPADASTASAASRAGVELPLPLPAILPVTRTPRAGDMPAVMNQHIAYQAQLQHQAQLALQSQVLAARSQYLLALMATVGKVQLLDACRLALPASGAVRVQCREDADAISVRAVLASMGTPPALPGESGEQVMQLALNPADGRIQERIEDPH